MGNVEGVLIRLADAGDASALADLRWRLKTGDEDGFDTLEWTRFVEAFVASTRSDDGSLFHWVAELNGRLIGVMSIRRVLKVPAPEQITSAWGYLTNCYLLPEYRNRGIGTALLNMVKRWAAKEGFELLVVWPSERSYSFYERGGFERLADPLVLNLAS